MNVDLNGYDHSIKSRSLPSVFLPVLGEAKLLAHNRKPIASAIRSRFLHCTKCPSHNFGRGFAHFLQHKRSIRLSRSPGGSHRRALIIPLVAMTSLAFRESSHLPSERRRGLSSCLTDRKAMKGVIPKCYLRIRIVA